MLKLRPLPIGSQTFSYVIEKETVYVDKTAYLHALVTSTVNKFFLSRPRRFGKSLTLSTLEAIFLGKKELFKGLYIAEETEYGFPKFPVLRFDFSKIAHENGAQLEYSLKKQILHHGKEWGVPLDSREDVKDIWEELVRTLSKEKKVVILIDEYDKPILDHITDVAKAKENRDILKGFYEVIKANDEHVRFVFITGITKFSQMNIFSGMNNLKDLTLNPEYGAMLGYTQEELEFYFKDHIRVFAEHQKCSESTLLEKIKKWYNGFRFSENPVTVYNPFSTLLLLDSRQFLYHWFATGTPTYLMQLIQSEHIEVTEIEGQTISLNGLESYNLDTLKVNFIGLMVQAGYLTVVKYLEREGLFELGYPNLEVKEAFTGELLACVANNVMLESPIAHLRVGLEDGDLEKAFHQLKIIFAKIPYEIQEPKESYYQSLFYLIFTLIGTRIQAEVRTNKGRIDAMVETKTHIYLFEFKLEGTAQDALDQIEEKGYGFGFQDSPKALVKIGVAFSLKERNISEFKIQDKSTQVCDNESHGKT